MLLWLLCNIALSSMQCCGCCGCNAMLPCCFCGLLWMLLSCNETVFAAETNCCCGCNAMLHTLNTKFSIWVTKRDNAQEIVPVKCIKEDDRVRPYRLERIFACLLVLKHNKLQFLANRWLSNQHRDLAPK